jgi:heptosyltransferase I
MKARGVSSNDEYIVLNTGGNWDLKQWPKEKFAELARRISLEKNIKVVLPGSADDIDRVKEIEEMSGAPVINIAGETCLPRLAVVFAHAKTVVSADSGPSHLAVSVGARLIALFGPTRPEITGPRGQGEALVLQKDVGCNKAPCYYLECQDNRCMKVIEVEDVLKVL